jgi:SAM-dependent methyltransferase
MTSASTCPVCSRTEVKIVGKKDRHGRPLTTVACTGCGLVRTEPLPPCEEISAFHGERYRQEYKGAAVPARRRMYRAGRLAVSRWELLKGTIGAGARVLDVGAASGEWLYVLGRQGCDAEGIEIDGSFAAFGVEAYGVRIRNESTFSFSGISGHYDVVTAFHVLEHLHDPVAALRRWADWVREDGRLIVEVPNIASRQQNPNRIFHEAHVYGFTAETLRRAGERAGLRAEGWEGGGDDRNVLAVFRRDAPRAAAEGVGQVPAILEDPMAAWKYYLNPRTYGRALTRIGTIGGEWAACRLHGGPPRTMLDRLIG